MRGWRLRILALSFSCWGGGDIFRRELDYRAVAVTQSLPSVDLDQSTGR
jgi:hypothetical protein